MKNEELRMKNLHFKKQTQRHREIIYLICGICVSKKEMPTDSSFFILHSSFNRLVTFFVFLRLRDKEEHKNEYTV